MSETPNTPAGHMTDRIMMAIKEHIAPHDGGAVNGIHHYNRAWEKVYALLETVPVARIPDAEAGDNKLCGKLFVPKGGGKFTACGLPKGHREKCKRRGLTF